MGITKQVPRKTANFDREVPQAWYWDKIDVTGDMELYDNCFIVNKYLPFVSSIDPKNKTFKGLTYPALAFQNLPLM